MKPSAQMSSRVSPPGWHPWVCFCLALFLLYNPFQAVPGAAYGLQVRHPASNRATVGSSELQHLSPSDGQNALSAENPDAVVAFLLLPEVSRQAFVLPPQVNFPQQQFYGSNLWFRPPPVF